MSITRRLVEFFAKRTVSVAVPQAQAWNPPRSPTLGELPKAEAAPEPTPALGASALLDAWKARESALSDAPDPPKSEGFSFPQGLGPRELVAPALGPVMAQPRHLAAFAPWFIAIGGAMGLGGWLLLNSGPSNLPGGENPNAARSGSAGPVSAQAVMCPSEPVVPAAGD